MSHNINTLIELPGVDWTCCYVLLLSEALALHQDKRRGNKHLTCQVNWIAELRHSSFVNEAITFSGGVSSTYAVNLNAIAIKFSATYRWSAERNRERDSIAPYFRFERITLRLLHVSCVNNRVDLHLIRWNFLRGISILIDNAHEKSSAPVQRSWNCDFIIDWNDQRMQLVGFVSHFISVSMPWALPDVRGRNGKTDRLRDMCTVSKFIHICVVFVGIVFSATQVLFGFHNGCRHILTCRHWTNSPTICHQLRVCNNRATALKDHFTRKIHRARLINNSKLSRGWFAEFSPVKCVTSHRRCSRDRFAYKSMTEFNSRIEMNSRKAGEIVWLLHFGDCGRYVRCVASMQRTTVFMNGAASQHKWLWFGPIISPSARCRTHAHVCVCVIRSVNTVISHGFSVQTQEYCR